MRKSPQLIIVGTSHRLQAGHDDYTPEQHRAFEAFLEGLVSEYHIEYVAEEMVTTILSAFGVAETLVKRVSARLAKKHAYVDLEEEFRNALDLDRLSVHQIAQSAKLSEPQFAAFEQLTEEMREYIWLVRILKENTWPTLFVCGARHASRVRLLFSSVGVLTEIKDYEPEV